MYDKQGQIIKNRDKPRRDMHIHFKFYDEGDAFEETIGISKQSPTYLASWTR